MGKKPITMDAEAAADDNICWNFVKGKCPRGDSCRYLHVQGEAALGAAKRALVRRGSSHLLRDRGQPEAASRLEQLLVGAGLVPGAQHPSEQWRAHEEDWGQLCSFTEGNDATGASILEATMSGVGLGDEGMMAWCNWADRNLSQLSGNRTGPPGFQKPPESLMDFSANQLGSLGARALCALLEKYGVRSSMLDLSQNNLDDEAMGDVTRFLTVSGWAPALAVNLSGNACSPMSVRWLLTNLAMHPAYPIWSEEQDAYVPLNLHLGEESLGEAQEDFLKDVQVSCAITVHTGAEDGEDPVLDAELACAGWKHNCIARLRAPPLFAPVERTDELRSYIWPIFSMPQVAPDAHELDRACRPAGGAPRLPPRVLYEDKHLSVVHKPAGWHCTLEAVGRSCVPRKGLQEELKDLQSFLQQNGDVPIHEWLMLRFGRDPASPCARDRDKRFGVCHRLDVNTSGPMLCAKTPQGYSYARSQIDQRLVVKDYVALVHGSFKERSGECRARIEKGEYKSRGGGRVHIADTGDAATTLWSVVAQYESAEPPGKEHYSLVHCRIITGRTHQIRIHMSHMGHPIVSDWQYCHNQGVLSRDVAFCPRIFLHKVRVAYMDMAGVARSVSSSLRIAPELWKALSTLRMVVGPGKDGAKATAPSRREE